MDTIFKKNPLIPPSYQFLFLSALILSGVYLTSFYSFLLFHTLTEIFSVLIACGVFVIVWNSRRFLYNRYLLFIGVAYLFVGCLDLLHTLSYKGMGVFPGFDADLPTQLWIISRYMESLSLLIAPVFLGRELKLRHVLVIYLVVTMFLLNSVFYWQIFPACFIEGEGLTPFKQISEYLISLILLAAFIFLLKKENEFDKRILRLIAASIFLTIMSELAFTFYISVYGFSNLVGHFFKIISFYLIYKAVIETGFNKPYDLLFRDLKQSEIQAKEYLNIAGAIFVVVNADQKVSLINKRGTEVLGCEEKEIVGKNWFDNFVPPRIREEVKEGFQKLLEGKTESVEYFENSVLTKSGEERIIEWHNKLIRDEFGNIIRILSSGEDITEKKRAEELIRKSEEKYRTLTENLNVGVYRNSVKLGGKFIEVNPALVKMFGFKNKEEFLKIKVTDIYQKPESRKKFLEKLLRKGFVKDEELRFKKKDGTLIIGSVSGVAVKDEKGEVKYCDGTIEDITERKKAEEELLLTQFSVERSSDAIFWIAPDSSLAYVNEQACRSLGYTKEELLAKNIIDLDPNFDEDEWKKHWKTKKDKPVAKFETLHKRKDGTVFPVEIISNYLVYEEKEYAFAYARDITERKKNEEKLRLTQFTIEKASDAAFWIDRDANISYVNEAACRLLGYTKEELLSATVYDLNPNFPPEIWKEHWEDLKKQVSSTFESQISTKDGRTVPVEISANYIEFEGKEYNCAFDRDITERKKAEEELRKYEHIVSTSSDFLSIIDRNYTYQAVNDTYCKTFNKKREDLIGLSVSDIVGETVFKNTIKPRMDQAFKGKKVQYQEWFDFPGTGHIYLDLVYNPYIGEDGKVKGIVFCARDMTELQFSQEKIEKSLEEKELLLKEIHHRVKNNMQIISSLLTLQSSSLSDKKIIEVFGQCQDRIKSMALVHEKLYQTEDFSMINFKEYIKTLTKSLFDSYREGENEINLKIDVKDVFLDIDTAIPLGLIINELISNSLKHAFSKNQGGEIGVFLNKRDEENFILKVWDNGIGFPEELDFRNTESLGLQLVTLLVEKQLKGEIDLNKNELTEFCVTFKRTEQKKA
jgi:PAS domain S-box-containing protein